MKHLDFATRTLSNLHDTLCLFIDCYPIQDWSEYLENQRRELNLRVEESLESKEITGLETPVKNERQYHALRQRLMSAREQYNEYLNLRREEWRSFAAQYDEPLQKALEQCIDTDFMHHCDFFIHPQTGSLGFSVNACASYRQTIYFNAPAFSGDYDNDMPVEDMLVSCAACGYQLSFIQKNGIVTVDFSDATFDIQLWNYSMLPPVNGSAWSIVSAALAALAMKREMLGDEFLTADEKALGRLNEFCPLHNIGDGIHSFSMDRNTEACEQFYAYAVKAENVRVAEKLRRYLYAGLEETDPAKRLSVIRQADRSLRFELNKPESWVLAWMILADIKRAASEYPIENAHGVSAAESGVAYHFVTEELRAKGYEGEYPHFRKLSALRGVRLVDMQGQPVFVGREKHMASIIDCYDYCTGLTATPVLFGFAVSTVLLEGDSLHVLPSLSGTSGYSHRKTHRRRFRSVVSGHCSNETDAAECLPQAIATAAKTAELEKLSATERKRYSVGGKPSGFIFTAIMALFSGALFGLLLLPALALVALLFGLLLTLVLSNSPSFTEYLQMLLKFPWHYAFAFCVLGFGIPFAVVIELSKKRG